VESVPWLWRYDFHLMCNLMVIGGVYRHTFRVRGVQGKRGGVILIANTVGW